MCGICGQINYDPGQTVDSGLIERMASAMSYRGPDDKGVYVKDNAGLGHRRLSIIDLETGRQPLSNEDRTIWVVFNGEIYNYLELRDHLVKKGHQFKTKSDTEVLVHLYEEFGEEFVHKLRGMFAIAIWDEKKRKLILARDRIGKKPLFYTVVEGKYLIFASEIKSILQNSEVKREVDLRALDQYLGLMYVPAPLTMFQDIRKLPAGHMLILKNMRVEIREYWDLHFNSNYARPQKFYEEKLEEILTDAVNIRLRSDVPLGAFLSGGIDSSVIVSYMSRILDAPVETSSIGFNEKEYNELSYARQIADICNCKHHEFIVAPDVAHLIPKLVWHFDEPFADSSAIPTYYVSKMARENVTVAFSGDGGDEVFAGYPRYFVESIEQRLRKVSRYFSSEKILSFSNCLPDWIKGRNSIRNLALSSVDAYIGKHSYELFARGMKDELLSEPLKNKLSGFDTYKNFKDYYLKTDAVSPLDKALYVDMKTYLVDDILVKVDRMSMANSLEVRAPLLDHKLMEFMASVPPDLKLRGSEGKFLLKRQLPKGLDSNFKKRRKQGFSIPLHHWLKNELRDLTEDCLFGTAAREREYFNNDYVSALWSDLNAGRNESAHQVWLLLNFEMWHQRFIDNNIQ